VPVQKVPGNDAKCRVRTGYFLILKADIRPDKKEIGKTARGKMPWASSCGILKRKIVPRKKSLVHLAD